MSSDELTTIAQKAARGGLFLFIGNASSTVILAVGAILVARLLGPFSYGLYTLAGAIPLLLVALADAGMSFALVRLPARLRSEGAVEKQDILNLRTLLGGTRIVAVLVNPVLDYESKLLSVMGRN